MKKVVQMRLEKNQAGFLVKAIVRDSEGRVSVAQRQLELSLDRGVRKEAVNSFVASLVADTEI